MVKRFDSSDLKQFFAGVGSRIRLSATPHSTSVTSELKDFFATVSNKLKLAEGEKARTDKVQATRFNVFDLIDPDENKLSDIIADLLDPRGGHGQGTLFLGLLFKQLWPERAAALAENIQVQREAPTYGVNKYRRRMDILVVAGTWLAIENKVDSAEQPDQVKDYLEHLKRCTQGNSGKYALIYLTPNGRPLESVPPLFQKRYKEEGKLFCWSYLDELRTWLESCKAGCKAQKICYFLTDFLRYIETSM